jgi:hypothetical protein
MIEISPLAVVSVLKGSRMGVVSRVRTSEEVQEHLTRRIISPSLAGEPTFKAS